MHVRVNNTNDSNNKANKKFIYIEKNDNHNDTEADLAGSR